MKERSFEGRSIFGRGRYEGEVERGRYEGGMGPKQWLIAGFYSPMTAPILTPPPPPSARVASLTGIASFPSPCGAPLVVDSHACTVIA
jgi:hypothetical protein